LAVVDVPDGAHVHVRLITFEYALSHCRNLQVSVLTDGCRSRPADQDGLIFRHSTLGKGHCANGAMSIAKCRAPPKLVQGIEPWTSSLPRTRSTTELYQRDQRGLAPAPHARSGSVEGR